MNKSGIVSTWMVLIAASFSCVTSQANCTIDPDCPLVWSDEFDGSSLDMNKWSYMVGNGHAYGLPGWGNNERQYYTTNNDTVANGVLTITAKDDGFGGYNYTSTRLRTKDQAEWTYGRIEMRAKLPTSQGMWPAFWMLPTDESIYGTWAASGEIDIMETIGSLPDRILGTIHYGGNFPANQYTGNATVLDTGSAHAQFHTYAIEWQAGEIRWYVDDTLYSVQNNWYSTGGPFPAPFDVDFHLLLNLAVGGNLPGNPDGSTIFPMDYVIDYVRVYELPANVPTSPDIVFDDMEHGSPSNNGWFAFDGNVGGGNIGADSTDRAPLVGGTYSLASGYGSGGTAGFVGGFGREFPIDLGGLSRFNFWIKPEAGQQYIIEINLQDDDNNDNTIPFPPDGADDEFQFICQVGPTGPCAIADGGWQQVSIPLSSFTDDNSFHYGGNGAFDPFLATNGQLINVVFSLISTGGSNITFKTDYWSFGTAPDTDGDGILDAVDNCSAIENTNQIDADNDGFGNLCDPDLNNDNIVNFGDVALFSNLFLSSDSVADLNSDGTVNFGDFIIMTEAFLSSPGPGAVIE